MKVWADSLHFLPITLTYLDPIISCITLLNFVISIQVRFILQLLLSPAGFEFLSSISIRLPYLHNAARCVCLI